MHNLLIPASILSEIIIHPNDVKSVTCKDKSCLFYSTLKVKNDLLKHILERSLRKPAS